MTPWLLASLATATALPVCTTGPPCFADIQAAIDAAVDGDVVEISPGVYDGALIVYAKRIDLVAAIPMVPPILVTSDPLTNDTLRVGGGAVVTIRQITFASAFSRGLRIVDPGTSVVVDQAFFAVGAVKDGSAVQVQGESELLLLDSVFAPTTSPAFGGHVNVTNATVTVVGTAFSGGVAGLDGGSVHATGTGALTLSGCTFEGNIAYRDGGAVAARGDVVLTIEDSVFLSNDAGAHGGGLFAQLGEGTPSVAVSGSTFTGNAAPLGGGASFDGLGPVTVTDAGFDGGTATSAGGAIAADDGISLALTRVEACGNTAGTGGGGGIYYGNLPESPPADTPVAVRWVASAWVDNAADGAGGGAWIDVPGSVHLVYGAWLGNSADDGGALAVPATAAGASVSLVASLVAWSDGRSALYDPDGAIAADRTVWFDNDGVAIDTPGGDPLGAGEHRFDVDPLLFAYSADGDCANDDLGFRTPDGPLLGFGVVGELDADGSPADAGALGGPDAPAWAWTDDDVDGAPAVLDCADDRSDVYPDAPEACYDGLDADCDGASDFDCDLDGAEALAHGGTDCDDAAANVHLGSPEIPYNGIDEDCSGADQVDVDGDGYVGAGADGPDCDDADPAVHPDAVEDRDRGVDRDCDGWTSPPGALHPVGCAVSGTGSAAWLVAAAALRRRRYTPR